MNSVKIGGIFLFLFVAMGCFKTKIKYNLLKEYTIKESLTTFPFQIFQNRDQMEHVLTNPLFKLGDVNIVVQDSSLNFAENDIMVSIGRPIDKLIAIKDECNYAKEKPVDAVFSQKCCSNKIYIYSLPQKGLYRTPCP